MPDRSAATTPSALSAVPRGVWALGLVSLFMDLSTGMIQSVLPLFLVSGIGAGAAVVGLVEGIAEGTAAAMRVVSGVVSDRIGRRKGLALAGYGLSALTRPLFPLASGAGLVIAARFVDRVGKGIRGAPRDALVADLTPPAARGAAYGLRQALDTVGDILAPLAAMALLLAGADFRLIFWVACVPALACVAVLALAIHEPPASPGLTRGPGGAGPVPIRLAGLSRLGRPLPAFLGVAFVYALARVSEAFPLLSGAASELGNDKAPLVMVVMNIVYAAAAFPAGRLSDRFGRPCVLAAGIVVLTAAQSVLSLAGGVPTLILGAALWGLHLALTQGVLAAVVADLAPAELRGTAFGLFHMVTSIGFLAGNVAMGALWQGLGAATAYAVAAAVAGLSLAALAAWSVAYGNALRKTTRAAP